MTLRGRLAVLTCAAALAAVPLPARAANGVAFLIDRQGGYGILDGNASTYASFDVYGESFRAVVLQPPIVALTTHSYGCVTFNGPTTVTACGNNFTVTITGALSTAQITGSATSGAYTIAVNVTITANMPPDPYVASSADAGNPCSPPLPLPSGVPPVSPTVTPPPVPNPPSLPSPSPSPTLPTPPARTCFVYANPGVQREGTTAGTITLYLGGSPIGQVSKSATGWIYAEGLGEVDAYTP